MNSIDSAMGTAKDAIDTAGHAAKGVATGAAEVVMDKADDAAKTAKKVMSFLRHIDADDVLGLIGLRRRRTGLETIALIGGGVLLGVGVAFLLAPTSGREMRLQIGNFLKSVGGRAKDEANQLVGEAKEKVGEVKEKASEVVGEVKEKVGEVAGQVQQMGESEGAQTEEGPGRSRRRNNQNAQVS